MALTALLTGATTGIGYELARHMASKGHDLIIVARNGARLRELAAEWSRSIPVRVHPIATDLSVPGAVPALWQEIERNGWTVDILVNNAGFGSFIPYAESSWEEQLRMMQLNMVTLAHLTHLCLPGMVARRRGWVLNVASTAAFQPGPFMAMYYSSKAFVLSFSQAVGEEVRGTGVSVTTLCPGPTPTEFQARAGARNMILQKGIIPMTDAAFVARAGYEGMLKRRRVVVPGWLNRMGTLLVQITPTALVLQVVRRLHVFH